MLMVELKGSAHGRELSMIAFIKSRADATFCNTIGGIS
jgi:hypothetical protein